MVIVGLDTETTGFSFTEKKDRIVEACFAIYIYDGKELEHKRTITQRINPERSIPADAQAVHGISFEDVKLMPKWAEFADTAKKILDRADVVVIHNAAFDVDFLVNEQDAAGQPLTGSLEAKSFCTMTNARWATFDGKSPSLKELCWSLGIEYDVTKAHAAEYDVHVMMACYEKAVALGLMDNPFQYQEP